MAQIDAKTSFRDVCQLPPQEVLAWTKSIVHSYGCSSHEFNWLGLAELASFRAKQEFDLVWAEVATVIFECLSRHGDQATRHSYMLSAMMLRAFLIAKKGTDSNNEVLDSSLVVAWFLDNAEFSLQEATQLIAWWDCDNIEKFVNAYGRDKLTKLRRIKQRLYVLTLLPQDEVAKFDSRLVDWIALKEKMP